MELQGTGACAVALSCQLSGSKIGAADVFSGSGLDSRLGELAARKLSSGLMMSVS
jgi:hypothetical protein